MQKLVFLMKKVKLIPYNINFSSIELFNNSELLQSFIPNKVLQCTDENEDSKFPLLANKDVTKKALIYLCKNYACKAPVNTVQHLLNQLKTEY